MLADLVGYADAEPMLLVHMYQLGRHFFLETFFGT
jgi:hypothetical protein